MSEAPAATHSRPRSTARVPVGDSGETLAVDWIPPADGQPVAWFVHGFGSNRRGEKALYLAEQLTALGWGFLAADLRGHGESDGELAALTLSRALEDMAAIEAWCPRRDAVRLIIGSSMGAAVSGWHLCRGSAKPAESGGFPQRAAVVWIAPSWRFPNSVIERMTPAEREAWAREGTHSIQNEWLDVTIGHGLADDAARYDPEALIAGCRWPLLILHGTEDDAVPWQQSLEFVERVHAPRADLLLIKHGDHRLTQHKRYLADSLEAWWNSLAEG